MPTTKTVTRTTRRGGYRKKRYRRKRNQLAFAKSPVPLKMFTKLKYVWQGTIDPPAAGTGNQNVFSGNGCYDPDISGVGTQPRGFDQLMALYDHYVVLGSKCTARFSSIDASNAQMVYIALRDSSTQTGAFNNYAEGGNISYKVLAPRGTGESSQTVTYKASVKKFLGRSRVLSDPELKGSTSNNPTEQCFFHVGVDPMDTTVDSAGAIIVVEIEYLVALIEPKVPTQS